MNRWQWIVIVLVIVSLGILVADVMLGWNAWNIFDVARENWARTPPQRHMTYDLPPLLSALSVLITMFLAGVLALFLAPVPFRNMNRVMRGQTRQYLRYILLGGVVFLFAGVLMLSASLSMGTFPLVFILGFVLFLCAFSGSVLVKYALGNLLLQRAGWGHLSPVYALLLGTLIVVPLTNVPFLGMVLHILLILFGTGVVIATRFGTGKAWTFAPLEEE